METSKDTEQEKVPEEEHKIEVFVDERTPMKETVRIIATLVNFILYHK